LQSEADRAAREADLARARRWPQLELGPAVTIGESTTVGLALGLSLPLWNRQSADPRGSHDAGAGRRGAGSAPRR
jgi:outer membrane protein TolC